MKTTNFFLGAALALASLSPALADAPKPKPDPAANTAPVVAEDVTGSRPTERQICSRIETTGTRLGPRVCFTQEEWRTLDQGGQVRQYRDMSPSRH